MKPTAIFLLALLQICIFSVLPAFSQTVPNTAVPVWGVNGVSGAKNSIQYYEFTLPSGLSTLYLTGSIPAGKGSVYVYAKYNSRPTLAESQGKAGSSSSTVVSPPGGKWHVSIFGRTNFSQLSIKFYGFKKGDPIAVGDVVTRDMKNPITAPLGHIGIYTGSGVLEVNDRPKVIDTISLEAFKTGSGSLSGYRGARYNPKKYNYMNVINAGMNEAKYNPSYTLSTVFFGGGVKTVKVWNSKTKKNENQTLIISGQFRCDTFVIYCFKKGVGLNVRPSIILPQNVADKFPNKR